MSNTTDIREALEDLAKHFDFMGDHADAAGYRAWEYDASDEVREWAQKNFPRQG